MQKGVLPLLLRFVFDSLQGPNNGMTCNTSVDIDMDIDAGRKYSCLSSLGMV